jgi:hypothetical protein
MLNQDNVFAVSRRAYELLNGPKGHTSRSLRRFLLEVTDGQGDQVIQSFAYEDGYSKEQLDALEIYASRIVDRQKQYLTEGARNGWLRFKGLPFRITMRDDAFGIVGNVYALGYPLAEASVAQLRAMVEAVVVLSDCMHDFAANPMNCITSSSGYRYRGLPCSIAPDEQLWYVGGQDLLGGGGGILEWCYDEADAQQVLKDMQRFPGRFANLNAESYAKEMERCRQLQAAA